MTKKQKWLQAGLLFALVLLAAGCRSGQENDGQTTYNIYYVNHDATGVLSAEYTTESTDTDILVRELLSQLGTVPNRLEYQAPLAGGFELLDYSISENQLTLSFDENYKSQELTTEILVRAAIVRTLIQIKDIQYVSFLIRSEPLTDASGNVIGVMNKDTFIDNAGNEINTYEKVRLRLYFANEEGNGLTALNRNKVYNSNISIERLIVEELIAGPREEDAGIGENQKIYPVMNPETKIVSINVRDGVCYVNLDSSFLTQVYNVTPEVTIYAITNSLVELSNVNKVQISINGDTNINYRENISFSTVFERNLDLVEE